MTTSEISSGIPARDPRRVRLGRSAFWVLVTAAVFMAFSLATKQLRPLGGHAPWRDDPYDAVVSFTVFFVPLMSAVSLVRVVRCRREQPLPAGRVLGVLRGCRVIVAAMLATVASDWISVVLQADRDTWTTTTAVLVVLLGVVSLGIGAAGLALRRAATPLPRRVPRDALDPDWFQDLVSVAESCAVWFGPLATMYRRALRLVDRAAIGVIRGHPILAAAVGSLGFGVLLAGNTLLREGSGPALWLDVVVGGCGMFTFLVAAGAYVGLVRGARPAQGPRRRLIDAAVIGCAAVPFAVAFREWLWWVVGGDTGGAQRLAVLLAVAAASAALVVLAGESVLGVHARKKGLGRVGS